MGDATAERPPLVSVIVATYNRSAILPFALRSLQNQTFTDWEAWIVGDGCTDETEAVVRGMNEPRFHWLNLPINSGSQSAPNNAGLRAARGTYVAYLGHDDLWFPWHLEALTHAIAEHDAAHGILALIGPDGAEQSRGARNVTAAQQLPPSSWLHRREAVGAVGWWRDPEMLSLPVDNELLRRMCASGIQFALSPRLSVLKFKSATWRMYALSGTYPQQPYFAALLEDPHALHDRVLTELALAYARHQDRQRPVREVLHITLSRLVYGLGERHRDNAMVERLMRWRFQRYRKRMRRQRGLES